MYLIFGIVPKLSDLTICIYGYRCHCEERSDEAISYNKLSLRGAKLRGNPIKKGISSFPMRLPRSLWSLAMTYNRAALGQCLMFNVNLKCKALKKANIQGYEIV